MSSENASPFRAQLARLSSIAGLIARLGVGLLGVAPGCHERIVVGTEPIDDPVIESPHAPDAGASDGDEPPRADAATASDDEDENEDDIESDEDDPGNQDDEDAQDETD